MPKYFVQKERVCLCSIILTVESSLGLPDENRDVALNGGRCARHKFIGTTDEE